MTELSFHGIAENGLLTTGSFSSSGQVVQLRLADGTARSFGRAGSYADEAIARLSQSNLRAETDPVKVAKRALVSASSVVLEITQFCKVGCPTCIASSIAVRQGELPLSEIERRLDTVQHNSLAQPDTSIMISGGEPTEHPKFLEAVSSPTFLGFPQRYVITSGLKFTDAKFVSDFARRSPQTQVYLQYDSFVGEHLVQIRGSDFTDVRIGAIANLEKCEIPYTLVCVVLGGVNDSIASEIAERNLAKPNCVGVTLQPIKFVGRNDFAREEHRITAFDLVSQMRDELRERTGIWLNPHTANPLNWAIGYASGEPSSGFGLYKTGSDKRVAVVWHTDKENYVLESVAAHPIAFAEASKIVPLEVHYKAI